MSRKTRIAVERAARRFAAWYTEEKDEEERELIFREVVFCMVETWRAHGLEFTGELNSSFLRNIPHVGTDTTLKLIRLMREIRLEDHQVQQMLHEMLQALVRH